MRITSLRGFSMMELVIGIAIMSIFFVAMALVFFPLNSGILVTRTRTVATNLAQEKIEFLKNIPYSRLRVTSMSDLTAAGYDRTYYPPETGILIADIRYERRILIQRVKENAAGKLIEVLPDEGDTGLKKITITVLWSEHGKERSFSLSNLRENPNRRPLDGTIQGTIRDQDNPALTLSQVAVSVVDNLNWNTLSDNTGNYTIRVPTGTYQVKISKDGYWPQISPLLNVGASPTTCDINLKKMAAGTLQGYVFYNDHLVISQVAGSTVNAAGFSCEYVELFNPTTWTWTISADAVTPVVDLKYQEDASAPLQTIKLNYANYSVPPNHYYLIANTNTVTVAGQSRSADAVYDPIANTDLNVIKVYEDNPSKGSGSLGIAPAGTNAWIDCVGWDKVGKATAFKEGQSISQNMGIEDDEQFVRRCSPGCGTAHSVPCPYGKAYDSNNNNTDFLDLRKPMTVPLHNSGDTAATVSGTPAVGAIVSCNDGLSSFTTAYAVTSGGMKLAWFSLPYVTTGTWSAAFFMSTGTYASFTAVNGAVVPYDGATVAITNAATSPAWPASGMNYTIINGDALTGLLSGKVTSNGVGVQGIKVDNGVFPIYTTAGGFYSMQLDPGIYTITANPGNLNPSYTSQITTATVSVGQVTSGVDFDISPGGAIGGRLISNANDLLADMMVIAYDKNNNEVASVLTRPDGSFVISNLPTSGNMYRVTPSLDAGESSNPAERYVNVVTGSTMWTDYTGAFSTFTVLSAYGNITGQVTASDKSIETGVLIIASTATITSLPPNFDYTLRTGNNLYYGTVSQPNGTYSLQVRGGFTYNVYAWYTTMSSSGVPQTTRKQSIGNLVHPSNTITVDFSWP